MASFRRRSTQIPVALHATAAFIRLCGAFRPVLSQRNTMLPARERGLSDLDRSSHCGSTIEMTPLMCASLMCLMFGNRRSKRDAHGFQSSALRIVTTDSFDSRSVSSAGDRIQASTQKKFSDRKCSEQLDFTSAGIARAMTLMMMRYARARTNNMRVLSLFYRYKSRVDDMIDIRSNASLHRRCILLSLCPRRVAQCLQQHARVHVSLSGVAVSCILV
jgi:hypothetical protein